MSHYTDLGRMVALRNRQAKRARMGCKTGCAPGCACQKAQSGSLMRFYLQDKGPAQFSGTQARSARLATAGSGEATVPTPGFFEDPVGVTSSKFGITPGQATFGLAAFGAALIGAFAYFAGESE